MSSDASSPDLRRTALILARELDRRRRRNRLARYRPYARQREFHEAGAEHRERLFMAGNQLGKTLAGSFELSKPSPPTICRRGSMAGGVRADQLLVDRGLVESRARGQALILAGLVFSGERKIEKAGQALKADAPIEVRGRDHPWVSRGGVKLAHGLAHFGWSVEGMTALDIGSSTGGFTDVLLCNGAHRVYAVDVGTNQLAWKLRQDDRVVVLEQTNARYLTVEQIPELVNLIVCDASFISLKKILPVPMGFARSDARMMALIKPQFEAGRDEVGKGGVVRDPEIHARICADVEVWIESHGWRCIGITPSPITGPEGNIEFLMAAEKLAGQSTGATA